MPEYPPSWLVAADVATWLRLNAATPDVDDPELDRVCSHTQIYVQDRRPDQYVPAADPADPDVFTPDAAVYNAAVMYAARLYRRRNSPTGTEAWAEGGITFVARYDGDIARALRTDIFTVPGFG